MLPILGLKYPPQQYRFYYPAIKGVCAADLLNRLVYVPCNPLDTIQVGIGLGLAGVLSEVSAPVFKTT